MGSHPKYEALSYTWGADEFPKRMTVADDETQIAITESLFSALQFMRFETETHVLWMDAVCINQKNIPEKNDQVARMDSIYRNAEKVLVFLGEEDQNAAFDKLEQIAEDSREKYGLTEMFPS
jgi:hypothetical protein